MPCWALKQTRPFQRDELFCCVLKTQNWPFSLFILGTEAVYLGRVLFTIGTLRSTTATSMKTSPQNITLRCRTVSITPSCSRPTMWANYPKNKLARAVSEEKCREKGLYLYAHVFVKTSNVLISRCCYAEYR